jgi:hypothetical protein
VNDRPNPPATSFQATPPQEGKVIHPPQPQGSFQKPPQPALAPRQTSPQNTTPIAPQRLQPRPLSAPPQNLVPVQQQPIEMAGQTPQSTVGFNRITKDGSIASPFDPKAVNSPLGRTSNGIDPNKSTPVPRPKAAKVPLANNSDVHNRMGQLPQMGPGTRKVGYPPVTTSSPGKVGFHARAVSCSSLAGVKRDSQGQPVG